MKQLTKIILLFSILPFLSSFQTDGLLSAKKESIFQYIKENEIGEMVIEYDPKQYRQRSRTDEYSPAKLSFVHPDGNTENWKIEVRSRGKMRRKVCVIPPMKLRFSNKELKERGLKKRRTLKMVNICRDLANYEQMLLREYLAYQLYNHITDYSFRVHLVKMKYIDTKGEELQSESFAFLIEHQKDLADRTDLTPVENPQVGLQSINTDESEIFTLFQYMIGNTDWYYFNTHNVELFRDSETQKIIPIPYDFDYSGLVKAPYAIPDDRLKLEHVSERFYQGRCRPVEETQKTINLFLASKETIMKEQANISSLSKYSRKYVCKYLSNFFKTIEKPKRWKRAITNHCDKWPVE